MQECLPVRSECDVLVIGGGMAGASIAAHLAEHASVHLLEMEPQPGYHATGRSAAVFVEPYGNETVRALTRASREFLYSPPPSFCSQRLVKPRTFLLVARTDQASALQAFLHSVRASDAIEAKSAREALELHPLLRPEDLFGAAFSPRSGDIDVHALHQGYLRLLQSRNGVLTTLAQVLALDRSNGGWSVTTASQSIRSRIVVNAAGAWAGAIGKMAGALDIGLQPLKRTACLVDPPPGGKSDLWPMLVDAAELFYLKPDAGVLLLSPADETEIDPCDVYPDDLDVAVAVDRIERATTLEVKRVRRKWAGLRSFVKDRSPVVGFDPYCPGFFWLAALGGYGIQTAPALSRIAASLALGVALDDDLLAHDIEPAALSPDRLLAGRTRHGYNDPV
jgi:D-arginine dehydrogenase